MELAWNIHQITSILTIWWMFHASYKLSVIKSLILSFSSSPTVHLLNSHSSHPYVILASPLIRRSLSLHTIPTFHVQAHVSCILTIFTAPDPRVSLKRFSLLIN